MNPKGFAVSEQESKLHMNDKPDLLVVLVTIFVIGAAVSGYTHSRGIGAEPDVPVVSLPAGAAGEPLIR